MDEKPELVLMDMMMPDMDGLETCRQLRRNPATEALPVVLFTAKPVRSDSNGLDGLGILGIIMKPFDPLGLGNEISRITGKTP